VGRADCDREVTLPVVLGEIVLIIVAAIAYLGAYWVRAGRDR
jgi:hypothetical protein